MKQNKEKNEVFEQMMSIRKEIDAMLAKIKLLNENHKKIEREGKRNPRIDLTEKTGERKKLRD